MKSLFLTIICILFTQFVVGQSEDSVSIKKARFVTSFIPIECLDSAFFIEKHDEMTSYDIATIIGGLEYHYESTVKRVKNSIIEGSELFNTYLRHKLNRNVEEQAAKNYNLNLIPIYNSDLLGTEHYAIRAKFNYEDFDEPWQTVEYYIYDKVNKTSYKSVGSLEEMLKMLSSAKEFMRNGANRKQEDLDLFCEKKNKKNNAKPNRGTGNSGPIIMGIIVVLTCVTLGLLGSLL